MKRTEASFSSAIFDGIKGIFPGERAKRQQSQELVAAISPISEQILPDPQIVLFQSSEKPISFGLSSISRVSLIGDKEDYNKIYYQMDELNEALGTSDERVVLKVAETGELSVVGAQAYVYQAGFDEGDTTTRSGWNPYLSSKEQNHILAKAHATLPYVRVRIGLMWEHEMNFDQKTELLASMLHPIKEKFFEEFETDIRAVDGVTQSIYDNKDNPIGRTNVIHFSVSHTSALSNKDGSSNNHLPLNLKLFSLNIKFAHPDQHIDYVGRSIDFQVLHTGQLKFMGISETEISNLDVTYLDPIESPDQKKEIINSAIRALDYHKRENSIINPSG